MKIKLVLILIILILPVSLFAFDFGLVAGVNAGYGYQDGDENAFTFRGDLWPRFSALIGDNAELYIAAGLAFDYNNAFTFIPELFRTEFSMRFGDSGVKIGRIDYSDPLSFVANGLFDGVQCYLNTAAGRFNASLFYTGLLYKKTAGITMTAGDIDNYSLSLDYSDFIGTYFAPKKIIATVDWSHPSVLKLFRLNASAIFQFDLSGSDYHSQYLVFKGGYQTGRFLIEAGGAAEFSQNVSIFNISFAGELGFTWLLPASFNSVLSFKGVIAAGRINETFGEFIPVTSSYFGNIFVRKMSALSVLSLNYSAQFNEKISASLSAMYFIRNDLAVVSGYPVAGDSSGYFLGPEIFARLVWKPVSDVQLNASGGVFLPALGDAGQNEKPHWRLELKAVISIL